MPESITATRLALIPQNIRPPEFKNYDFAVWEHNPTAVARLYGALRTQNTINAPEAACILNKAYADSGDRSPKVTADTLRGLCKTRYGKKFSESNQNILIVLAFLLKVFVHTKKITPEEYMRVVGELPTPLPIYP
jgi:hypothetical protein